MKKKKLLILAALCALAFTGCKKKEPIDLTSLHTTAAVEKETIAETEEETEAPETEADSAEKGSAFSLKTEIKKETVGSVTVEYPVVSSMKDAKKQETVNALLKSNALAIADVHPDEAFVIKAAVESANLKRLTVTYRGEMKNPSGKTERLFYANTVDLETVENLGLQDLADAYTVAGYIASGDYKLTDVSGSESSIRSELNGSGRTTDYYYKLLQKADFSGGYDENATPAAHWPEVFSYEKQGVVYISLPVSSELGSYVLIHYSPDNK